MTMSGWTLRYVALGMLGSVTAGAPAQSAAADAASEWSAVTACAARPDDRSRHACLDAVLREAGLLTPEREVRQQRERFGLEAGTAAAATAPTPERSAPPAAEDRLEAQVSRIVQSHDGKLTITTADGAIWRQTEGGEVRPLPAAGDPMSIRKASLGSYVCQVRDTLAFRCSRSR